MNFHRGDHSLPGGNDYLILSDVTRSDREQVFNRAFKRFEINFDIAVSIPRFIQRIVIQKSVVPFDTSRV